MNAQSRLRELMDERGWTEYRLAKESGLSQSTISNLFHRNNQPSLDTLSAICGAMGISLSQFFSEGELVELNAEQRELFERYRLLTPEQKRLVLEVVRQFK